MVVELGLLEEVIDESGLLAVAVAGNEPSQPIAFLQADLHELPFLEEAVHTGIVVGRRRRLLRLSLAQGQRGRQQHRNRQCLHGFIPRKPSPQSWHKEAAAIPRILPHLLLYNCDHPTRLSYGLR